jgi:hypothetical protein
MKTKLVILFILCLSKYAYACKCGGSLSVEESFKATTLIIHGKVLSKELVLFSETIRPDKIKYIEEGLRSDQRKLELFQSNRVYKVTLEVVENFKESAKGHIITLYTSATSASCGYRFEVGKEYLLYGIRRDFLMGMFLRDDQDKDVEKENTFWTNHCTRTTGYDKLEADSLRKLKDR